jgi:hypothetical protein
MPSIMVEAYNYLITIQFHPIVTMVVFLIIAVGKLRWEMPYIDEAKRLVSEIAKVPPNSCELLIVNKKLAESEAYKIENYVMAFAFVVSIIGEFAMYWPKLPQQIVICFFMSIAQIGAAWIVYFYVEKWGIIDNFGMMLKKKIDKR